MLAQKLLPNISFKKKKKTFRSQRFLFLNYSTARHIQNSPPSKHTEDILPEIEF